MWMHCPFYQPPKSFKNQVKSVTDFFCIKHVHQYFFIICHTYNTASAQEKVIKELRFSSQLKQVRGRARGVTII